MRTFPGYKGGLAVPSLSNIYEQLWLKKRNTLKTSPHSDINHIWSDSSHKHIPSDSLLINGSYLTASASLKKSQLDAATSHFHSLECQGIAAKTIEENVPKRNISLWSSNLNQLSNALHNFAKKALQGQLSTSGNLDKWKRVSDPSCPLCAKGVVQTNNHILSNCGSPSALNRYTKHHDAVLLELANWILQTNYQAGTCL